ncbi:hypothetical protein [Psychrobacter sp. GP33]|uniref:Cap15 family cyclic dinucleotide receptor domain-containing protein n=1 Tax=Psychrobacter sp. GP33 TaxID=2758709 RepID=UPI0015FBBA5C|nr:hypothetical protein [Psychrobacter sp. GP33]
MEKKGHGYGVQNAYNRSHVSKYVYAFATVVSWLLIYDLLKIFEELPSHWNTIISTLTTGILFLVVHFLCEKWLWKMNLYFKRLKHTNISGQWSCDGVSSFQNDDMIKQDIKWKGTVLILQSWANVKIRLETEHSVSNSISATIVYDESNEYKLLYSYENRPKNLNHAGLRIHRGFGELTVNKDDESAIFKYYNVEGRETIATMSLKLLAS